MLLAAGGFVPTSQICEVFSLNDRQLRSVGTKAGLLDSFAVSSTKNGQHGFIHQRYLPTDQWLPIKHRLLRHAIAELRKVKRWEQARKQTTTRLNYKQEVHSGQLLLL
jgi:hypothetical protein